MQKMYDRMQTQDKDTRLYDHNILNVVNELCMNYKIMTKYPDNYLKRIAVWAEQLNTKLKGTQ